MITAFSARARSAGLASAMSRTFAPNPSFCAARRASAASASAFPNSLAKRITSFVRCGGLAASAAACPGALATSIPARKPESQARCVGLAAASARLSAAISSGSKGAVAGSFRDWDIEGCLTRRRRALAIAKRARIGAASLSGPSRSESPTVGPMTTSVASPPAIPAATAPAVPSVARRTRWRFVVASLRKATGSSGARPAAISASAITPIVPSAM